MPQYQGVWSLAQQAQAQASQRWVTDPLFDQTVLLLQADDPIAATNNNVFLDESFYRLNITRNGNTTQGSFSPFSQAPGYWAAYGNGSSAMLTYPTGTYNFFGNKNCIEMWLYPTTLSAGTYYGLLLNQDSGGSLGQFNMGMYAVTNNTFQIFCYSAAPNASVFSTAIGYVNQWNHLVFFIDGTSPGANTPVAFAVNGIVNTTTQNWTGLTSSTYPGTAISVGGNGYFNSYVTGYISNLRVVKASTYPYSLSNFNPPTRPLTAIPGTQALLCQNNFFYDANTQLTPKTITVGSGTIQPFSPFPPLYQCTPTVTGGSAYFDGTSDSLSSPSSSASFNFSGNYTVEFWMNVSSRVSDAYLVRVFDTANSVDGYSPFAFYFAAGPSLKFYSSSNGTSWNIVNNQNLISTIVPNQWYHIALTRSGTATNNTKIFVNGVQVHQYSDNTAYTRQNGLGVNTGAQTGTHGGFQGYISGLRVLNGTGYTSITVPTVPPTTVANDTGILLNFTNAGIFDGTMRNAAETIGNAQISTSVWKYGNGSMVFDGTDDRISIPTSPNLDLGSGDFTIECWAHNTAWDTTQNQLFERGRFTVAKAYRGWMTATAIVFEINLSATATGSYTTLTATITNNLNQWYHVAFVRFNNVFTIYRDGVALATTTNTGTAFTTTEALSVGGAADANNNIMMIGYIDDFRITKGIARYNRNFTPPQAALPRQ